MLTALQISRTSMCVEQINGLTLEAIADKHDCSVSCVRKATAWGKRAGIFNITATHNLHVHIAEHRAMIKELESEWKLAKKSRYDELDDGTRIKLPIAHERIAVLSRELRAWRETLMKLEGAYDQVLTVKHEGEIVHKVDLTKLTNAELTQFELITAKARNGHGPN